MLQYIFTDVYELNGPNPQEIMQQLDVCELSNSCATTPNMSRSSSNTMLDALPLGSNGHRNSRYGGNMERTPSATSSRRVRSLSSQSAGTRNSLAKETNDA